MRTSRALTDREAAVLARLAVGPVWRAPEHVAAETGLGVRAAIAAMRKLRGAGLAVKRPSRAQRPTVLWAHKDRTGGKA